MTKTLTISQPFAGLLILGIKHHETRSWNTKHRGKLAIHSSARMTADGKQVLDWLCKELPDVFFPGSEAMYMCTQLGMVLGTVNVTDTVSTNENRPIESLERLLGDYSPNRYYWKCENPVMFAAPVPAVGKLSIWNWEQPSYTNEA
jgi:hypothetical protein